MQNPNPRAIKGTKKTPKLPNNFQKDARANCIDAALAIKINEKLRRKRKLWWTMPEQTVLL
jgi:hypothetical protein